METLKLAFFILGSAAFLGFIIFFIALLFNKDGGFDSDQGRINYLSREVDRLEKKIDKETECKKSPLDWDLYSINTEIKSFSASDLKPTEKDLALAAQKQQFDTKEKKYIEKIRQLEKILADEEIKVSDCGNVTNLKADKLKYEKYELNLEKSHLQKEVLAQKLRVESFGKYLEFDTVIKGSGYNTKVTWKESKDDKKTKKVILNVTEEDENILDAVDKLISEVKSNKSK